MKYGIIRVKSGVTGSPKKFVLATSIVSSASLFAILCAATLMLLLLSSATVAFANPSSEIEPIHSEATGTTTTIVVNGEPIAVQATVEVNGKVRTDDFEAWKLVTGSTSECASGVATAPSNSQVIVSFETHPECITGEISEEELWSRAKAYNYTFRFNLHTNAFDGKTAYVYIDHHNGPPETLSAVIENGYATIHTSLSTYTFVIDMNSGGGFNKDTSAISPQTGVSVAGGVDGASAAAADGAMASSDTMASGNAGASNACLEVVIGMLGIAALITACAMGVSLKNAPSKREKSRR